MGLGGRVACVLPWGCFVCACRVVWRKRQAKIEHFTTAVDKLLSKIRERASLECATKLAKFTGKGALAFHPPLYEGEFARTAGRGYMQAEKAF